VARLTAARYQWEIVTEPSREPALDHMIRLCAGQLLIYQLAAALALVNSGLVDGVQVIYNGGQLGIIWQPSVSE